MSKRNNRKKKRNRVSKPVVQPSTVVVKSKRFFRFPPLRKVVHHVARSGLLLAVACTDDTPRATPSFKARPSVKPPVIMGKPSLIPPKSPRFPLSPKAFADGIDIESIRVPPKGADPDGGIVIPQETELLSYVSIEVGVGETDWELQLFPDQPWPWEWHSFQSEMSTFLSFRIPLGEERRLIARPLGEKGAWLDAVLKIDPLLATFPRQPITTKTLFLYAYDTEEHALKEGENQFRICIDDLQVVEGKERYLSRNVFRSPSNSTFQVRCNGADGVFCYRGGAFAEYYKEFQLDLKEGELVGIYPYTFAPPKDVILTIE